MVLGGSARISGSTDASTSAPGPALTASQYYTVYDPGTGYRTGWMARAQETVPYGEDWRVHVNAICATVST